VVAFIPKAEMIESQLKGSNTELNQKLHKKQTIDSKHKNYATLKEHKNREAEMKQELDEY
jgi:hypothetical protein